MYGRETWFVILKEERRLRVYENRVMRRIFGPKRDKVTWEWGKVHDEELKDLYCSSNIAQVTKLRGIRWVGHLAWMGRGESYTGFYSGNCSVRGITLMMSFLYLEYRQYGCSVHHLNGYLFTNQKYFIYQKVYSCTQIDGKNTFQRNRILDSKIAAGNSSSDVLLYFIYNLLLKWGIYVN